MAHEDQAQSDRKLLTSDISECEST